jgi:(2Fe-2S) ferredoxin
MSRKVFNVIDALVENTKGYWFTRLSANDAKQFITEVFDNLGVDEIRYRRTVPYEIEENDLIPLMENGFRYTIANSMTVNSPYEIKVVINDIRQRQREVEISALLITKDPTQ